MMTVLKPGPLTTVQDGGRRGYRAFGMPVAGAMDRLSFALANVLSGNPPGAAALEMTLLGATVRLEHDGYLAVCGADMGTTLDGEPVPNGSGFPARRGAELVCRSAATGCRAYLAVHGGIDVPTVLGSSSTYTRAAVGGFQGRALRSGDVLPVGPAGASPPRGARALPARLLPDCPRQLSLRVLLGPQEDHFLPEGVRTFLESAYAVSNRNDRMGYQLDGPAIGHRDKPDIVSDALCPGAIQVPGRGTPIVMMADCQTTGGYAKIATVIGPDLALLAQARFGDTVRFVACSEEEAVAALREERVTVAGAAAAFRAPARRRAARG
ncbi:MAG: biotin-dependent carboxyltransferase family protein [Anaeromyxobacteraceae bacterium]